jgi:hypothetical protein
MNIVEDVLQKLGVKKREIFTIDESRRLLMIDTFGTIWTPKCPDNPTGNWETISIDVSKLLSSTASITHIPWLPHTGQPYYALVDQESVEPARTYGFANKTYLLILECRYWKNDILERALYRMNMVFQTFEECNAARSALIKRYPNVYGVAEVDKRADCIVRAVQGHTDYIKKL